VVVAVVQVWVVVAVVAEVEEAEVVVAAPVFRKASVSKPPRIFLSLSSMHHSYA